MNSLTGMNIYAVRQSFLSQGTTVALYTSCRAWASLLPVHAPLGCLCFDAPPCAWRDRGQPCVAHLTESHMIIV